MRNWQYSLQERLGKAEKSGRGIAPCTIPLWISSECTFEKTRQDIQDLGISMRESKSARKVGKELARCGDMNN